MLDRRKEVASIERTPTRVLISEAKGYVAIAQRIPGTAQERRSRKSAWAMLTLILQELDRRERSAPLF